MCLHIVNNGRHIYLLIQSYYNHVRIKTCPSLVKASLSQRSITVYNVVYQLPGYRIHAARLAGHSTNQEPTMLQSTPSVNLASPHAIANAPTVYPVHHNYNYTLT